MIRKAFELLLALWVVAFIWHATRSYYGRFGESMPATLRPESGPGDLRPPLETPLVQPLPLEEEVPVPQKKSLIGRIEERLHGKRQEDAPSDDGFAREEDRQREGQADFEGRRENADIRRQMPRRPEYGLPRPDAHFSGLKFFIWSRGPQGEWTCPGGERLLEALTRDARRLGFTVGDDFTCDVCVIRVPPTSERCPRLVFFEEGREQHPALVGAIGPQHLPIIWARIPRSEGDVDRWQQGARATRPAGSGVAGWGPGLGIRYRSNTDVGVGLGLGSGWSAAPCGGS